MRAFRMITLALLLVMLFSGCSQAYNDMTNAKDTGQVTLTPDYVAEISRELASSSDTTALSQHATTPADRTTQSAPADTTAAATTTAHTETTASDHAAAATTTHTETTSSDRSTDVQDIVYWTVSGSVWHTDKNCSSLEHANEILSGTVNEAIAAKKSRVCKKCG